MEKATTIKKGNMNLNTIEVESIKEGKISDERIQSFKEEWTKQMHGLSDKHIVDEQKMGADIKEQIYSDQPDMSEAQAIQNYLSDNNTKMNAVYWAKQFDDRFRGNWFTVEKVVKKTSFKTVPEALAVLQVMCLVGVCHSELSNGKTKYKIVLDLNQKVSLLKHERNRLSVERENSLRQLEEHYKFKIAAIDVEIEKADRTE